ncbi:MAG: aldolase [Spirochaetales bacterium]|nr:aldolase [Spirochaetales bacterium]
MKEIALRKMLEDLKSRAGLVALKTGTEVEDMNFQEIADLRRISAGIVPLYVKVGGPEARSDIRECLKLGVDTVIAPMIESPYALKNFMSTMDELDPEHTVERGINLETITAFQNLNPILTSPAARGLSQVTAARSDLSGSMDLPADHDRVLEVCAVMIARCREYDLKTSVGGNIHSGMVAEIIRQIRPVTVNTRHMVVNSTVLASNPHWIDEHLQFEYELCRYLGPRYPQKKAAYARRAETLEKRLRHPVSAS